MKLSSRESPGFSLVEVVIAIGIVSFAILGIVGLLPAGLKTVKNANENAGAANVLNAVAESIRAASTTDAQTFTWSFAGVSHPYQIAGGSNNVYLDNLTLEGVATNALNKRLRAYVSLNAPTSLTSPGYGTISVAWSAQAAKLAWDSTLQKWTNADGSVTTAIQFLPRTTTP